MEANESTPIAPVEASSPTFHHSSYHEELEDVICDVADLCYGVYVPVVPAAGNPLSRASRLFRRKIRKSSTQDDIDDAKDTPLVKPLLEGVNCKVYAGEMVAVMVSLSHVHYGCVGLITCPNMCHAAVYYCVE